MSKILAKTKDDWLPEDVFHEIKTGTSFLYSISVEGERKGFAVLQLWPHYHAGPRLFVRALWGEPGTLVAHKQDLYDDLKAIAFQHKCKALRMTSPRRWELDGWTPKQTIYEMEV